ncbi:MAG: nicotinate-nucleotide adenylyltransferase [Acidobacteriia bacterium]|nr:nicotinate-nucleotide adenylyltransferase [Terriglobia bacterium]
MNIALFGGTFDPIHAGHLHAARAAARRFRLDRVLFVPTGDPPHKVRDRLTAFAHRYAMVTLACAGKAQFVPSLLETPTPDGRPRYSIDTVRAARRLLRSGDKLFFLLGVDAFLDLPHWKEARRLLDSVNFLVVSRPGFDPRAIREAVPDDLLESATGRGSREVLRLRHTSVQVLHGVDVPVASRDIREAVRAGQRVTGLVPPLVEEYIRKEGLYRSRDGGRQRE